MSKFVDRPEPPPSHVEGVASSIGLGPRELSDRLFGKSTSWDKEVQSSQEHLEVGDSVILLKSRGEWYWDVPKEKKGWRSAPNNVGPSRPPQFLLYELHGQGEQEEGDFRVYWNPKDLVDRRRERTHHHRKKDSPWRVWHEEVFPLNRMSLPALTIFGFHSEEVEKRPDLVRPIRIAWKRKVLSDQGVPHILEVLGDKIGLDPDEHLFDIWGGALSWRAQNDFAPLPSPREPMKVMQVQQHVQDFLSQLQD